MEKIDLFFFDMDGTLVDSKKVIINAANFTLTKLGLEQKSDHEILQYVGSDIKDLLKDLSKITDEDRLKQGIYFFKDYWSQHLAEEAKLFPHVKEVLDHFKQKHMLILSNGNMAVIKNTLSSFGITKYFKDFISGDDQDCLKPTVCPLSRAIDLKDSQRREKAIMVGDMAVDVQSGKAAGIKTCAVTYGMGDMDKIRALNPDFLIDDLAQLMDLIQ